MAKIIIDTAEAQARLRDLNDTLKETNEEIKDTESASSRLDDAFENTSKATNDLNEGMGIADTIIQTLTDAFSRFGGEMGKAVASVMPALIKAFKGLTAATRGWGLAMKATGLGLIVAAVSWLAVNWEKVSSAMGGVIDKVKEFGRNALGVVKSVIGGVIGVGNVIATMVTNVGKMFRALVDSIVDYFQLIGGVVKDFGTTIGNAFVALIEGRFRDIGNIFRTGLGNLGAGAKAKLEEIGNNFSTAIDYGKAFRDGQDAAERMFTAIGGFVQRFKAEDDAAGTGKMVQNLKEAKAEAEQLLQVSSKSRGIIGSRTASAGITVKTKTEEEIRTENIAKMTAEYEKQGRVIAFLTKLVKKEGEEADKAQERLKNTVQTSIESISSIAGSLADMVEENSAAYKALMTVQVIATTAAGAMTAFTAIDLPTAGKWAQFAAVLAAGAAQLHSIWSETLDTSSSSLTASVPTLSAPAPSQAVSSAQLAAASANGQQVYITEKQLDTERANNVKLVKNTVF